MALSLLIFSACGASLFGNRIPVLAADSILRRCGCLFARHVLDELRHAHEVSLLHWLILVAYYHGARLRQLSGSELARRNHRRSRH